MAKMGWEPHLKVRKLEYNDPHFDADTCNTLQIYLLQQ